MEYAATSETNKLLIISQLTLQRIGVSCKLKHKFNEIYYAQMAEVTDLD